MWSHVVEFRLFPNYLNFLSVMLEIHSRFCYSIWFRIRKNNTLIFICDLETPFCSAKRKAQESAYNKKFVRLFIYSAIIRQQNRNILLFLDNCSAHGCYKVMQKSLKNIKLAFFPPNCTSHIQPLDQGIIQSLKVRYLLPQSRLPAWKWHRWTCNCGYNKWWPRRWPRIITPVFRNIYPTNELSGFSWCPWLTL